MAATVSHPTQADLEAFILGKLDDSSTALVEAHLEECTSCQTQAASVSGDTFVGLLTAVATRRSAAAVTPPANATADTLSSRPPTAASPPTPPAELADHPRYRLLRPLGAGGMGAVWLAEHRVMNRVVAVKVIRPEFLSQPGAAERFRREVQAAARLSHPNIVTAFDAEQAGDAHLLTMEYIDGTSLAELLHERGSLPVALACNYVRQAALGLQHAHERGLVHRDLKPHNLMLTGEVVKIRW